MAVVSIVKVKLNVCQRAGCIYQDDAYWIGSPMKDCVPYPEATRSVSAQPHLWKWWPLLQPLIEKPVTDQDPEPTAA